MTINNKILFFALISTIKMFGADGAPYAKMQNVEQRLTSGYTPLTLACHQDNLEGVAELIRQGANVNAFDSEYRTPLMCATKNMSYEITKLLLDNGASPSNRNSIYSAFDFLDYHPFYREIKTDKILKLTELILSHPPIDPFLLEQVLDRFKAQKVKLATIYDKTYSLISDTLKNQWQDLIQNLINQQIEISEKHRDKDKNPLWNRIVSHPDLDDKTITQAVYVNLLNHPPISASNFCNMKDSFGRTILHDACARGNVELVELLLANGAQVNITDYAGNAPIHLAMKVENSSLRFSIVAQLIHRHAEINRIDANERTALHYACMACDRGLVKLLIACGASVDAIDQSGKTPLNYLITNIANHKPYIEEIARLLLLEGGADITKFGKNGDPINHIDFMIGRFGEKHQLSKNIKDLIVDSKAKRTKILKQVIVDNLCNIEQNSHSDPAIGDIVLSYLN